MGVGKSTGSTIAAKKRLPWAVCLVGCPAATPESRTRCSLLEAQQREARARRDARLRQGRDSISPRSRRAARTSPARGRGILSPGLGVYDLLVAWSRFNGTSSMSAACRSPEDRLPAPFSAGRGDGLAFAAAPPHGPCGRGTPGMSASCPGVNIGCSTWQSSRRASPTRAPTSP